MRTGIDEPAGTRKRQPAPGSGMPPRKDERRVAPGNEPASGYETERVTSPRHAGDELLH